MIFFLPILGLLLLRAMPSCSASKGNDSISSVFKSLMTSESSNVTIIMPHPANMTMDDVSKFVQMLRPVRSMTQLLRIGRWLGAPLLALDLSALYDDPGSHIVCLQTLTHMLHPASPADFSSSAPAVSAVKEAYDTDLLAVSPLRTEPLVAVAYLLQLDWRTFQIFATDQGGHASGKVSVGNREALLAEAFGLRAQFMTSCLDRHMPRMFEYARRSLVGPEALLTLARQHATLGPLLLADGDFLEQPDMLAQLHAFAWNTSHGYLYLYNVVVHLTNVMYATRLPFLDQGDPCRWDCLQWLLCSAFSLRDQFGGTLEGLHQYLLEPTHAAYPLRSEVRLWLSIILPHDNNSHNSSSPPTTLSSQSSPTNSHNSSSTDSTKSQSHNDGNNRDDRNDDLAATDDFARAVLTRPYVPFAGLGDEFNASVLDLLRTNAYYPGGFVLNAKLANTLPDAMLNFQRTESFPRELTALASVGPSAASLFGIDNDSAMKVIVILTIDSIKTLERLMAAFKGTDSEKALKDMGRAFLDDVDLALLPSPTQALTSIWTIIHTFFRRFLQFVLLKAKAIKFQRDLQAQAVLISDHQTDFMDVPENALCQVRYLLSWLRGPHYVFCLPPVMQKRVAKLLAGQVHLLIPRKDQTMQTKRNDGGDDDDGKRNVALHRWVLVRDFLGCVLKSQGWSMRSLVSGIYVHSKRASPSESLDMLTTNPFIWPKIYVRLLNDGDEGGGEQSGEISAQQAIHYVQLPGMDEPLVEMVLGGGGPSADADHFLWLLVYQSVKGKMVPWNVKWDMEWTDGRYVEIMLALQNSLIRLFLGKPTSLQDLATEDNDELTKLHPDALAHYCSLKTPRERRVFLTLSPPGRAFSVRRLNDYEHSILLMPFEEFIWPEDAQVPEVLGNQQRTLATIPSLAGKVAAMVRVVQERALGLHLRHGSGGRSLRPAHLAWLAHSDVPRKQRLWLGFQSPAEYRQAKSMILGSLYPLVTAVSDGNLTVASLVHAIFPDILAFSDSLDDNKVDDVLRGGFPSILVRPATSLRTIPGQVLVRKSDRTVHVAVGSSSEGVDDPYSRYLLKQRPRERGIIINRQQDRRKRALDAHLSNYLDDNDRHGNHGGRKGRTWDEEEGEGLSKQDFDQYQQLLLASRLRQQQQPKQQQPRQPAPRATKSQRSPEPRSKGSNAPNMTRSADESSLSSPLRPTKSSTLSSNGSKEPSSNAVKVQSSNDDIKVQSSDDKPKDANAPGKPMEDNGKLQRKERRCDLSLHQHVVLDSSGFALPKSLEKATWIASALRNGHWIDFCLHPAWLAHVTENAVDVARFGPLTPIAKNGHGGLGDDSSFWRPRTRSLKLVYDPLPPTSTHPPPDLVYSSECSNTKNGRLLDGDMLNKLISRLIYSSDNYGSLIKSMELTAQVHWVLNKDQVGIHRGRLYLASSGRTVTNQLRDVVIGYRILQRPSLPAIAVVAVAKGDVDEGAGAVAKMAGERKGRSRKTGEVIKTPSADKEMEHPVKKPKSDTKQNKSLAAQAVVLLASSSSSSSACMSASSSNSSPINSFAPSSASPSSSLIPSPSNQNVAYNDDSAADARMRADEGSFLRRSASLSPPPSSSCSSSSSPMSSPSSVTPSPWNLSANEFVPKRSSSSLFVMHDESDYQEKESAYLVASVPLNDDKDAVVVLYPVITFHHDPNPPANVSSDPTCGLRMPVFLPFVSGADILRSHSTIINRTNAGYCLPVLVQGLRSSRVVGVDLEYTSAICPDALLDDELARLLWLLDHADIYQLGLCPIVRGGDDFRGEKDYDSKSYMQARPWSVEASARIQGGTQWHLTSWEHVRHFFGVDPLINQGDDDDGDQGDEGSRISRLSIDGYLSRRLDLSQLPPLFDANTVYVLHNGLNDVLLLLKWLCPRELRDGLLQLRSPPPPLTSSITTTTMTNWSIATTNTPGSSPERTTNNNSSHDAYARSRLMQLLRTLLRRIGVHHFVDTRLVYELHGGYPQCNLALLSRLLLPLQSHPVNHAHDHSRAAGLQALHTSGYDALLTVSLYATMSPQVAQLAALHLNCVYLSAAQLRL